MLYTQLDSGGVNDDRLKYVLGKLSNVTGGLCTTANGLLEVARRLSNIGHAHIKALEALVYVNFSVQGSTSSPFLYATG